MLSLEFKFLFNYKEILDFNLTAFTYEYGSHFILSHYLFQ